MSNLISKELSYACLKVDQKFGCFYACSIPARELLEICKPVRAKVLDDVVENDPLDLAAKKYHGTQRKLGDKRPEQIKNYIETGVSAFPNSIIIGANIDERGFLLEEEDRAWKVIGSNLVISNGAPKAAIIDGQHRLAGFEMLNKSDPNLDSELLCSVYLDIPITYHAQIFSIINSTQRRVNKNLIYQLYQIDLDTNKPQYWSPDVLSVYMARGLGSDKKSKLQDKIILAIGDSSLGSDWRISLSSVVESILKFITDKPARDRDRFYSKVMESCERSLLEDDSSVWRDLYKAGKDKTIYERLLELVNLFYSKPVDDTAYCSSIGFTAVMDAFRLLYEKSSYSFEDGIEIITEALEEIQFNEVPRDKTTAKKAQMRNIITDAIVSSEKKFLERN